jgi:hypothetical protein
MLLVSDPPYSPYLVPYDFFCFQNSIRNQGKRYYDIITIKKNHRLHLKGLEHRTSIDDSNKGRGV